MPDPKYFLIYCYIKYSCILQRGTLSFVFVNVKEKSHGNNIHVCGPDVVSRINISYAALRINFLLVVVEGLLIL